MHPGKKRVVPVIEIWLQNGLPCYLIPFSLPFNGKKEPEEIVDELMQSSLVGLQLVLNQKGSIIVKDYVTLSTKINYEKANELLKKYKPWQLFLEGVGIQANLQTLRLYLPRILSLFKLGLDPKANSAFHVIQLTQPGKGKTTFYSILKNIYNIEIFTSFPSKARLIMDARSGALGVVYLRDIVVIDAFDKNLDKTDAEDFFSMIETGLANGIWTREKATAGSISSDNRRDVGFSFLGNIEGQMLDKHDISSDNANAREILFKIMTGKGLGEGLVKAFLDRIAIVDVCDTDLVLKRYLTGKYLKANVMKALKYIVESKAINQEVDRKEFDNLDTRMYYHALRVAKLLYALGINVEKIEDFAISLVEGDIRHWEKILYEEYREEEQVQKTKGKAEEVKEVGKEEEDKGVNLEERWFS